MYDYIELKTMKKRLIVGLSGASGIVYGIRFLKILRELEVESHLVMSSGAEVTLAHESDLKVRHVRELADFSYRNTEMAAPIASGSFQGLGMVVLPCSIRSATEIALGLSSGLLTRAGDVTLKERRRLVLAVRETPLHLGHLLTLTKLTELGAIIFPPVPAMYIQPRSIDELIDHTAGRILDLFGFDAVLQRWPPRREN